MTPTTARWALHYRPAKRRRKKQSDWTMHALFPTRAEAEAVAAEIGQRFRHLDLWIEEVNPEQVTNTQGATK